MWSVIKPPVIVCSVSSAAAGISAQGSEWFVWFGKVCSGSVLNVRRNRQTQTCTLSIAKLYPSCPKLNSFYLTPTMNDICWWRDLITKDNVVMKVTNQFLVSWCLWFLTKCIEWAGLVLKITYDKILYENVSYFGSWKWMFNELCSYVYLNYF